MFSGLHYRISKAKNCQIVKLLAVNLAASQLTEFVGVNRNTDQHLLAVQLRLMKVILDLAGLEVSETGAFTAKQSFLACSSAMAAFILKLYRTAQNPLSRR